MKKLLCLALLLIGSHASANSGAMIATNSMLMTNNLLLSNSSSDKNSPIRSIRRIELLSYTFTKDNKVVFKFYDKSVDKYYTQVGCPYLISNISKYRKTNYDVFYYQGKYSLDCINFKTQ